MSVSRILILLFVFIGSCQSRERLPGEGPVSKFERHGKWLHVFGGPNVPLTRLANLHVFGDFAPAHSPAYAVKVHGPPIRVAKPNEGEFYLVYETEYGTIWTGSQEIADGGVYPLLHLYPNDARPSTYMPGVILKHLRSQADEEWVSLYPCGDELPSMRIELEHGKVRRLLLFADKISDSSRIDFGKYPNG